MNLVCLGFRPSHRSEVVTGYGRLQEVREVPVGVQRRDQNVGVKRET